MIHVLFDGEIGVSRLGRRRGDGVGGGRWEVGERRVWEPGGKRAELANCGWDGWVGWTLLRRNCQASPLPGGVEPPHSGGKGAMRQE